MCRRPAAVSVASSRSRTSRARRSWVSSARASGTSNRSDQRNWSPGSRTSCTSTRYPLPNGRIDDAIRCSTPSTSPICRRESPAMIASGGRQGEGQPGDLLQLVVQLLLKAAREHQHRRAVAHDVHGQHRERPHRVAAARRGARDRVRDGHRGEDQRGQGRKPQAGPGRPFGVRPRRLGARRAESRPAPRAARAPSGTVPHGALARQRITIAEIPGRTPTD